MWVYADSEMYNMDGWKFYGSHKMSAKKKKKKKDDLKNKK